MQTKDQEDNFKWRYWFRIPVLIRAVISGVLLATAGTIPWAWFVSLNAKYWSAFPWAIFPTAIYLWIFWQFVRGETWPSSTSELRQKNLRARNLPGKVWEASIIAGILGLITITIFQSLLNRMARLPQQSLAELSHMPVLTLFLLIVMSAFVAGIVEETAFRGYMQGPIERKHGAVFAILFSGFLFGLVHFTHPEVSMILMPFYMAVAAVYGTIAYLTNSILPGMMLHTGGNILAGIGLLFGGQSEWQASPVTKPLIWESGTDSSFWISCLVFILMTIATVRAYKSLAAVVREDHETLVNDV
ncbi:MAG: CPBP family intramembrane glutamic endopeptidase [Flavisolibacter sp.]